MARPSYTTDLTNITTAESGSWGEITGYSTGGAPAAETDYFIQGTGCYSQSLSASKSGLYFSIYFDYGSDLSGSFAAGDCAFFWQVLLAGNAVDIFSNGGLRLCIGSGTGDFNVWISGGRDFGRNPYGGWQNIAIDPTYTPVDYTIGTPGSAYQYFGSMPNTTAIIAKGSMHGVDAIRYGRGELIVTDGDATDGYCTFHELSNANDANDVSFTADTTNTDATLTNISSTEVDQLYPGVSISGTGIPGSTVIRSIVSSTSVEMSNAATATNTGVTITAQPYNRWGLLQEQGAEYLWKGLMSIGTSGTSVDFRDSNRNITVDSTPRTYATFNKVEINNASSNVEWTNINFTALDASQLSPGSFEMIDDATVDMTGCSFTDMTTLIFDSNATINTTTFLRCGQVTQAGGTFDGCTFEESDAAVSILSDDPGLITNSTFTSDGSNHAIQCNTTGTYDFTGHTFTSYATTDGSTGNEVFYNNSGGSITLNASGVTGTISVRNGAGASTTVNTTVTITITVQDKNSNAIPGAEVAIFLDDETVVLASTPTDDSGQVSTSYQINSGGFYVRVRQSSATATFNTGTGVDSGTETITTDANHTFSDGDAMTYSRNGGSQDIGPEPGTWYAGNTTDSTLQLYDTAANAVLGGATGRQDLTSGGSETHTLASPTRYVANSAVGTIGTSNVSLTITMREDKIVT